MADIKELFEQIIEDGIISREEHDEFIEMVHADGRIDADESAMISRMFKLIQEGKLKVVDEERSVSEARRRKQLMEKFGQQKK